VKVGAGRLASGSTPRDRTPDTYDTIGRGYRRLRVADPRIAARIRAALGDARTVCNVGAGAGSYEPTGRRVVPVEPSKAMLAQRPDGSGVRAVAERLPFEDGAFDASLAVLTLHHWTDAVAGLREMMRVSRRQVVLTFELHQDFWLERDYIPALGAYWRDRLLSPAEAGRILSATRIETVPIPWDCTDGFQTAYWRRPERYLEAEVRAGISTMALLPDRELESGLRRLARDLETGEWARRYATLLDRDAMDYGYRLLIAGR
jgi:SAM-dependent methyltransferase